MPHSKPHYPWHGELVLLSVQRWLSSHFADDYGRKTMGFGIMNEQSFYYCGDFLMENLYISIWPLRVLL